MLRKLMQVFAPALIIAVIPVSAFPSTGSQDVYAQEDDPQTVVESFAGEINAGDLDGAMSYVGDTFLLTETGAGSLAIVGKPAFESVLNEEIGDNTQTELSDVAVEGDAVTLVVAFSSDTATEAGVDRFLQPMTITVTDGLITRIEATYDEDDAQTQEYLEFQEANSFDLSEEPGARTIPMDAQPGGTQTGNTYVADFDGLTYVQIDVTPGDAGVLQPAHFHVGTCATPGSIVQPLASVLDGGSFTVLSPFPVPAIAAGFIINVHKSPAESNIYTSCGVIQAPPSDAPTAVPTAPAPTATAGGGVTAPDTGSGPADSGAPWGLVVALIASAFVVLGGGALVRVRR